MNYVKLTYNKKWIVSIFIFFILGFGGNSLYMFGVFCNINLYFHNAFIGFCVVFCIYEHILKICFRLFENVLEV